jgi:metallo-beta-lactamase class B
VRTLLSLLAAFLFVLPSSAQSNPDWTTPIAPFQIADNLYYVGSRDLASFLITTPKGDILINGSLVSSPPLIRHSVEQLGLRFTDIRILLNGQAHYDHVAGNAEILRETHAKQMVMEGDAAEVEKGGAGDFPEDHYPPSRVDRVLHDGDTVTLGNVTLTAHKTAGHTRGCTTWTFRTTQHGTPRNVVILGGLSSLNYQLVAKPGRPPQWPGIASDLEHTFATLRALPCDIFLGAHGSYFDMLAKLNRRSSPADESVWIDPQGYRRAIDEADQEFRTKLQQQAER